MPPSVVVAAVVVVSVVAGFVTGTVSVPVCVTVVAGGAEVTAVAGPLRAEAGAVAPDAVGACVGPPARLGPEMLDRPDRRRGAVWDPLKEGDLVVRVEGGYVWVVGGPGNRVELRVFRAGDPP